MINKYLIGTWWIYKDKADALYTYKGPTPPELVSENTASFADDAEFGWMDLNDPEDHCYKRRTSSKEEAIMLTVREFCDTVNISLLNDMCPGEIKQIEIFPSGNWVMYD